MHSIINELWVEKQYALQLFYKPWHIKWIEIGQIVQIHESTYNCNKKLPILYKKYK